MSTPTLQDLRKAKFKTIKLFSQAYGCSTSKASGILHGNYHTTLTKDEVVKLAALFEVPFETCIAACDATYIAFKYYGFEDQAKSEMDTLKKRWEWEEELRKGAEQASKTGNWREWSFNFSFHYTTDQDASGSSYNHDSGSTRFYTPNAPSQSCYALLGISQNATEAQIKQAFRDKVKTSHDGNGGYTGDMDKLTRAKEQALAGLKAKV